ncbi:unnamed protein product, partial [Brassica rapa subsp. trilocularis]
MVNGKPFIRFAPPPHALAQDCLYLSLNSIHHHLYHIQPFIPSSSTRHFWIETLCFLSLMFFFF